MVTKKSSDKEKNVIQIKATTGAWWKSTAADNADNPDTAGIAGNSDPADTVDTAGTAGTAAASDAPAEGQVAAKPARKRAPRRPRAAKKEGVPSAAVEGGGETAQPTQPEQPQEQSAPPQQAQSAPPQEAGPAAAPSSEEEGKKSRPAGRRSRKRRPTAAKAADKQTAEPAPTEAKESAAVAEESTGVSEESAEEAKGEGVAEPKRSRSSRGRRGRRSGKKTAEKMAEREPEADQGLEGDDELAVAVDAAAEGQPFAEEGEESDLDDAFFGDDAIDDDTADIDAEIREQKRVYKLLINAEEPEECRLALLEEGRLESIHVSTIGRAQTKSNIYKAKIVAVEPSLQAAFIDYGTEKNGFLPFAEIHPEYYKQNLSDEVRRLVDGEQWKKLSITDVVERGQEVLAQVVKEEIGRKGANMTTFLSIPGRCVVLMPGSDSAGISRKISGEQRRAQLREAMAAIEMPEGIGWIVRTASGDINEEALTRDVHALLKLWDEIKARGQEMDGVGLVYEDQQNVLRFLREHFDPAIEEILVDDRAALEQVKAFVEMLPKDQQKVKVRLHQGARPIFNQYSVEDQIEQIYQPQVSLPSGGSIVIDPTEALVAIDVNSGSTSRGKNFEASIFQANMEAASELARQLRLRDLGGLIVVDFIDMRSKKHILAVEKQVRMAMRKDKAKVDFTRISKFGLMQISRQKLGAPIEAGNYRRCEHCKGRGTVRSVETQSLYYLRRIQTGASRKLVARVEGHFPIDVALYLLNNKRTELSEMENRHQVEIAIHAEPDMKPLDHEILFHKGEKESAGKKQA